jgi:hypothetical protein
MADPSSAAQVHRPMQGLLKPVETYNNVFCHQVYPESWASATPMTDLALQAGQGRTYKWFSGEPVFPFGAGISYTNFSITNLQARTSTSTGTVVTSSSFSCDVTNTGTVAGADLILVFAQVAKLAQEPSELRADLPVRQLCAFERTPVLAPGATVSRVDR